MNTLNDLVQEIIDFGDVIAFAEKELALYGSKGMLVDLRDFINQDKYDLSDFYDQFFFQFLLFNFGKYFGVKQIFYLK